MELSADPWRKMAFYSDREVVAIMDEVYARWEESGRIGEPLDYATDEELEVLAKKAEAVRGVVSRGDINQVMLRAAYGAVKWKEGEEE